MEWDFLVYPSISATLWTIDVALARASLCHIFVSVRDFASISIYVGIVVPFMVSYVSIATSTLPSSSESMYAVRVFVFDVMTLYQSDSARVYISLKLYFPMMMFCSSEMLICSHHVAASCFTLRSRVRISPSCLRRYWSPWRSRIQVVTRSRGIHMIAQSAVSSLCIATVSMSRMRISTSRFWREFMAFIGEILWDIWRVYPMEKYLFEKVLYLS